MLAPKGFTQTVSGDAYASARLIVSKKNGVLRFTPAVLALCAVLAVAGLSVMFGTTVRSVGLLIKGMMALVTALCGAVTVLMVLPERIRQHAKKDFDLFDTLSGRVVVTLCQDDMTMASDAMSRRIGYAKVKCCVETDDRFVIITDDDRFAVLEKACFSEREETISFFRDVFARCMSKG